MLLVVYFSAQLLGCTHKVLVFKLIWFVHVANTNYTPPRWIHFGITIKITMGRFLLKINTRSLIELRHLAVVDLLSKAVFVTHYHIHIKRLVTIKSLKMSKATETDTLLYFLHDLNDNCETSCFSSFSP